MARKNKIQGLALRQYGAASFFVLLAFAAICAHAQTAAIPGYCAQGAMKSSTSGLPSTNYLQGVVPQCTVTVYFTGTTNKATIYSDPINTVLSNPFTANVSGQWIFWTAVNNAYDVVLSGGIAPNTFPTPVTLTALFPSSQIVAASTPAGPAFSVNFANSLANAFQGDSAITINPTTHTFTAPNVVLTGTGPAATPICPNGPGGALTTSGCVAGIGANPAPPAFAVNFADSTATAFQADSTITINPTTHAFAAPQIGGSLYAALRQTPAGTGNNGIANSQAASQKVISDPSYSNTEQPTVATFTATPTWWEDQRNSQSNEFFRNPATDTTGLPVNQGRFGTYGMWGKNFTCQYDTNFKTSNSDNRNNCLELHYTRMSPGANFGGLGGGWNVGVSLIQNTMSYSKGILESINTQQFQNGTGDNAAWYCYLYYQGGYTAPSDEQNKCMGMNILERNASYAGTVTGGPLTNPTAVTTTPVVNYAALQGVGRYVINRGTCSSYPTGCPAAPYSGTVTNIAAGLDGTMSAITLTSTMPVSNAWGTLSGNCNTGTPNGDPPFSNSVTCTVTLTSGSFTCTDGSSVTGACSSSPQPPLICFAGNFHDCTVPTAVGTATSTQTITIPARMEHLSGTRVFQGGMAGYGQEMTAYTQKPNGVQPMPFLSEVYGSTSANVIQGGWFKIGGSQCCVVTASQYQFFNMQPTLSSVGTTVSGQFLLAGSTLTAPYNLYSGSTMTIMIANADDAALNGLCSNVIWTPSVAGSANIFFTCTHAGLTGTHTNTSSTPTGMPTNNGVTLNSYNLYPMAEVTDVRNNSVNPPTVDGTLALEPNVLGTVNTGDVLEETHHYAVETQAITGGILAYNPGTLLHNLNLAIQGAGAANGTSSFSSNSFAVFSNANLETMYTGTGGVYTPPNFIMAPGNWVNGLMFDHAPSSVLYITTSTAQQNNPNSLTNIFTMGTKTGTDALDVNPNTGDMRIVSPRMLSLFGGPVIISSDLAAQTFRGAVTVSAMVAPTLTVTPKIGQGGTLADGTYFYEVQARGGAFFSPRSTEASCVITGGSGTGSCFLSWTVVVAGTQYIPSGRATSAGELNFAAVNGQNNTTWMDYGTQTPAGGANASVVPNIVVGTTDISKAFTASGASHVAGLVPDPGVTAGTTKFLREDSTWAIPTLATATNCAVNSVSPAACGSAATGAVVVPTTTTTYTVNTTAVTANSVILLTPRTYTGNLPSAPTCVAPAVTSSYVTSAIVAASSFTITLPSTTGQTCWNYVIVN